MREGLEDGAGVAELLGIVQGNVPDPQAREAEVVGEARKFGVTAGWLAVGTLTPKSSATWGSTPMITNSVVPIPKAPMARARSARGMGET